jgi:hypothetical protein
VLQPNLLYAFSSPYSILLGVVLCAVLSQQSAADYQAHPFQPTALSLHSENQPLVLGSQACGAVPVCCVLPKETVLGEEAFIRNNVSKSMLKAHK